MATVTAPASSGVSCQSFHRHLADGLAPQQSLRVPVAAGWAASTLPAASIGGDRKWRICARVAAEAIAAPGTGAGTFRAGLQSVGASGAGTGERLGRKEPPAHRRQLAECTGRRV